MAGMLGLLTALMTGCFVYGVFRLIFRRRFSMAERIKTYTEDMIGVREGQEKRERDKGKALWRFAGRFAPHGIKERYTPILAQAGIPLKGDEMAGMVGASTLVGLGFGWLLMGLSGMLLCGIIGYLLPNQMLKGYLRRRMRSAEDQLVEFLSFTANAMRAGHSFLQALDLAGRELPDPLGQELRRTIREINLGLSVEDALYRLKDRIPTADFDLIVTAVLIQRQVGGDLAGILDSIASTIRGRQQVKAQVRTLTAQGRLSGWVISLLPLALLLIMNVSNNAYISVLWQHPLGIALLVGGAGAQLLGIYFIGRIIKVEV